jgi:hypothetical protein
MAEVKDVNWRTMVLAVAGFIALVVLAIYSSM